MRAEPTTGTAPHGRRAAARAPGLRGVRRVADAGYRVVATLWGWLAFAAGCAVWGVTLVPAARLLAPRWPGALERFSDATRSALRLYVATLPFMRVRVEGEDRRLTGPRIVVANHQSLLDSLVLIALEPRLRGPARGYMFRVPVVRTILRLLGFHAADVGELPDLRRIARLAGEVRERGGGLLFFPEGTRSREGKLGRFHRGAFRVAVDEGLPVQPVVIEGLDRVLPAGRILVRLPGRPVVRVRYLEPLGPPYGEGVRRDVVRRLADRVEGRVAEELARLRAEASPGPRR